MMLDKFSALAVLWYFLGLQLLSVTGALLKTECIHNANESSKIHIICQSRIEVVSIYYDHRKGTDECTQQSARTKCIILLKTGPRLRILPLYQCSYYQQGCHIPVGQLPSVPADCNRSDPYHYMLMEYRCVPETDFIDLCGDKYESINSTVKHLFRKKPYGHSRNCTCVIKGQHSLTAVNVGISTRPNCSSTILRISWVHTNMSKDQKIVSRDEPLTNEDFKTLRLSHIRLIQDCPIETPPVWFRVNPANGHTVHIQCGQSIDNSYSSSSRKQTVSSTFLTSKVTQTETSTESDPTTEVTSLDTNPTDVRTMTSSPDNTNAPESSLTTDLMHTARTIQNTSAESSTQDGKKNTPPLTEKNSKVIVGSVVGGIVLIIILVVVGVLFYRCKRREKFPSGEDSFDPTSGHSVTDNDVNSKNHQTFANNGFEERTSGYSTVGEIEAIIGNKNDFPPAESSTEYDQLQPATVFQTFLHEKKKAPGDQNEEVPVYDHTNIHRKGSHNVSSGCDVKHSDYDVLENKANLNSPFDNVEPVGNDTYDHIGNDHDNTAAKSMTKTDYEHVENSAPEYATVNKPIEEHEQNNSTEGGDSNAIVSSRNADDANLYHILEEPNALEMQKEQHGQYSGHAENSAPEYATVNKPREEPEQINSTEGDDKNAIVFSRNEVDANLYHILEEQNAQEIQTEKADKDLGRNTDIDNNNPKRFNLTENPAKNNDGFYHILEPQD